MQGADRGNGSDNSPDDRPYNRSGLSDPSSPSSSRTGSSGGKTPGSTHTTTVVVQGNPTTGTNGGLGPDLVRVVPSGAQPGEALQGPNGGGSATVQGYVPEQSIVLPPDEQALVQAYFRGGSGS